MYRKAISLRDGNSSGTNGNVLLRDSSTDPLAMNSHNISTDEVCTKRFLLRFLFLLEISMRPIFCVYVLEVEKPFTKKYHPIRLREIKQQMEHWNSNCSAQWMENGVSMSKAKHIIIWKGKKKLNPKSSSKIWRDRERKRRKWDTKIKTIPIYLNWLLHSSPHLTDHFQLSCPEFSRNQERTRKNVKQI